ELLPKNEIPSLSESDTPAAIQLVNRLHQAGLLTIPAGPQVVRLLPPLNLTREHAAEAIHLIESTLQQLA
ncbi:MAG: aspartate aminotransferase family protein, partial [Limisphaerales bacterium]